MKNKQIFLSIFLWALAIIANGQDTATYKLRLSLPLFDLPQNYSLPNRGPSMQQSLELSNDFYELSFWGIDALGDKLFIQKKKNIQRVEKLAMQFLSMDLAWDFRNMVANYRFH